MMRVDVEHRPWNGAIWLKRGRTCYGARWYGKGPVRKRAILKAMMRQNVWLGAPWLWE